MSNEKQTVDPEEMTVDTVDAEIADEAVAEPIEGEVDTESTGEDLTQQLEEARNKAEENWDKFMRSQAELENIRRRSERDLSHAHKYALDNFSQALLPVLDSLEMGIAAAIEPGAEVEKLREGAEMTLSMAMGVVEKFGIQQINPKGEKFNPDLHQAMSTQPTDEVEPNTVVTVYQKGYTLNERLIRPALVVVSQKVEQVPEQPSIDEHA